jgi:cytochrome c biogenesis protein CcmG, thiol:disulfide interchange protein DsbE
MTPSPGDRRARREAQRADARRAAARRTPASRWLLAGLIGAAVVVAAVLAIALSGGGTPTGGSSTVPPSAASGGPAASGSGAEAQAPVISGTPLPDFQGPTGDPAIGRPAPEVTGADFDGEPVAIEADGRPKIVLFLAHWCPHCQEEVPVVQAWITAGGLPSGVDIVSVATAIDPNAPNYPPDAWLDQEGWTAPVIVDPTNSVARAYGLSAFPFWVFIGPDGTVRARTVGSVPAADLEAMIRDLTGS